MWNSEILIELPPQFHELPLSATRRSGFFNKNDLFALNGFCFVTLPARIFWAKLYIALFEIEWESKESYLKFDIQTKIN